MFAPNGWVSLKDVYEYFVWYFSENDTLGHVTFTGDECYELTWCFANDAREIAVCTAKGTALIASHHLVKTLNHTSHDNAHVNLHFGTVGSGAILQTDSFPDGVTSLNQFLALTYGPFQNLPIIFSYDEFDEYLGYLANEVTDDEELAGTEDMSPRAVAKRILDCWKREPTLIQAELKALTAPKLSVRGFRFAWGLAVMDEPDLARPGRRKRKS